MRNVKFATTTIVTALLLLSAGASYAAPDAELWAYWQSHDESNQATINHSAWAAFLDEYLVQGQDGVNRVRYGEVSREDQQALDRYLHHLSEIPITQYSRDVQFAYWVNLYNALTVDVILEHYPVASIRDIDISPGWFSSGPWGKDLIAVEGKKLSLNDIEHRILRPIWRDPRIHYVVNCASLSCPNLRPEPYTAECLDKILNQQARAYINHPRGVRIEDGDLIGSSIYEWYQSDFGASEHGVIEHLMKFADAPLREKLHQRESIDDYYYNWSLNAASSG